MFFTSKFIFRTTKISKKLTQILWNNNLIVREIFQRTKTAKKL